MTIDHEIEGINGRNVLLIDAGIEGRAIAATTG